MYDNTSIFGLSGFDTAARAAFDMCIIEDERRRDEALREERGETAPSPWRWF